MNNKLNLKSSDVLNKKFEVELSGYSASEVDAYLDKILGDYRIYEEKMQVAEETIVERTNVINDKDDEISRMALEIKNLKEQLNKTVPITNMELAKELKEIKTRLDKEANK